MTTSEDIRSLFPFDHFGRDEAPHFMKYTLDSGRPMKVINIGAGYTGVTCCIRIPRRFKNIEFKCYEKNHDVGGTWLVITYPGVACDIPSHAYQATFETNPDWSQYYSSGAEILKYFKHIAVKYDAEKYITFNTKMVEGRWQEDKKMWKITLENVQTGEIFYDECNILIGCVGILDRPKLADIKNRDTYKGKLVHPARWDHTAVIGKDIMKKDTEDITNEDWDFVIGINSTGMINCLRAQIPHLTAGGAVVTFASVSGQRGFEKNGAYCASKYGVIGLSKCAAKELGPKGVRLNIVCLGPINTPMMRESDGDRPHDGDMNFASLLALNRVGEVEDVANLIEFLLSDKSSFITGATINIDGGWI